MSGLGEKIQQGVNYVKEGFQQKTAEGQKEADKSQAKNENLPIGERASAAGSAAKEKASEMSHGAKKEYHKESAQNQ